MKKVRAVAVIVLLAICMLSLVGCKNKTALKAEEFKTIMEGKEFIIEDVTTQFTEETVETVYIAVADNYQIEFFTLPTEKQADAAYEENKAKFEELKEGGTYTSTQTSNYGKSTLTSEDSYMTVSRIANTFMYVNSEAKYKDEIEELLEELGY